AYMQKLPNLGEGQGRDDVAYQFAAFLMRDLAIDRGIALDWLCRWDLGNSTPKGRDRLDKIIDSVLAYGQRPIGCGRVQDPTQGGAKSSVLPTHRAGHVLLRSRIEVY